MTVVKKHESWDDWSTSADPESRVAFKLGPTLAAHERQMTHHVGDTCLPDGHRGEFPSVGGHDVDEPLCPDCGDAGCGP